MGLALRHIPNLITVIRILLIVPIAVALWHRQLPLAISLFALAAASDALDGYLARRFNWRSELGGILDPISDKLLLVTVFVTLGLERLVPFWLMAAAIVRDAVIVGGTAAYRFFIGRLTAAPSMVSKLNTLCQGLLILVVVARAAVGYPPAWAAIALGGLVLATIVVSGIDYVLIYSRRAMRARRGALAAPTP